MASETGIVNIALARIGVERISSLDNDTVKAARVARDLFDEARDELLRSAQWNFATKRASLSKVSGYTPPFGYDHAYSVPSDFLRVVSVHPVDSVSVQAKYKLENISDSGTPKTAILSNSDSLYLRYVAQITDVNRMTPPFRSLLSQKLAVDIGHALDRSNTQIELHERKLEKMMARARAVDGIEDYPDRFYEGSWITSRDADTFWDWE
jgi:hypothetical protein